MRATELSTYNIVAKFAGAGDASDALDSLRGAGVDITAISVLRPTLEASERGHGLTGAGDTDEPAAIADSVTKGVVVGGAAGGAIGGLAGLLAGAAAVAIPGVGPALATGIWAGVIGGGAAGSTAGGLTGAFRKMWQQKYLDDLRGGAVLIAVHTDDDSSFRTAATELHRSRAAEVHEYDKQGELVRSA